MFLQKWRHSRPKTKCKKPSQRPTEFNCDEGSSYTANNKCFRSNSMKHHSTSQREKHLSEHNSLTRALATAQKNWTSKKATRLCTILCYNVNACETVHLLTNSALFLLNKRKNKKYTSTMFLFLAQSKIKY